MISWDDFEEGEGLCKAVSKGSELSFKPPAAVQSAARRGLELRKKHGRGGLDAKEASKQGIGSGVVRATNLANGHGITLDTIKRMHAYFSRHAKDKQGQGYHTGEEGYPSAGLIAWLLWGGDAGKTWADGIVARHNKKEEN